MPCEKHKTRHVFALFRPFRGAMPRTFLRRKPILKIIVVDKSQSLCIFAQEECAFEKGRAILRKKPCAFD